MESTERSRVLFSLGFGILVALAAVSGIAWAQPSDEPAWEGQVASGQDAWGLSFVYAQVITGNVPVYRQPADALAGMAPVRSLGAGYVWVSLADPRPVVHEGYTWYMINPGEYVRADYLAIYSPSTFHGVALSAQPDKTFGWMVSSARVSSEPGKAPAKDAAALPRYTSVTVYEEEKTGEWTWYRVGENQWVEQRKVGIVRAPARPEGIGPTDQWIDVNLYEQTLAAYEGDRMVYATLVSSGLPYWATEEGLFRIWLKVRAYAMSGRSGYPDYYFLEDVPWTMYFNRDFALHAAYWHDGFGFQHSHGCVNLSPQDARWLFEWTAPTDQAGWARATPDEPGTWVWVHQ
jgi:lipoprotein-anchoring transpeptidase ErfK/SrfK